jgi:hypothetical protein
MMRVFMPNWLFLAVAILFISCQNDMTPPKEHIALADILSESSKDFMIFEPKPGHIAPYPWQDANNCLLRPITIEHFRCRGSSLHSPRIVQEGTKEIERFYDCSGSEKHSLPLEDGVEHIYPILLDLVNEIQKKTNCPVIITSGHRCPAHQAYIDSSPKATGSKHLIGAQVSFYVQGLEAYPEKILQVIFDYYKKSPEYLSEMRYTQFLRYEKECDVTEAPWYNKEVFIKLYKKHEGRDFDNRHPWPYINIQVRFDRRKNEPITVSYQKANQLLRK